MNDLRGCNVRALYVHCRISTLHFRGYVHKYDPFRGVHKYDPGVHEYDPTFINMILFEVRPINMILARHPPSPAPSRRVIHGNSLKNFGGCHTPSHACVDGTAGAFVRRVVAALTPFSFSPADPRRRRPDRRPRRPDRRRRPRREDQTHAHFKNLASLRAPTAARR